jgi:PAS domain S-box-containing protein
LGKKVIERKHNILPQLKTAVFWTLALLAMYIISRYRYTLFHAISDGVTITIAVCAFLTIWNSRQRVDNDYFLFAGISLLFFAVLDLLHMLGNKGMGVFPEYGNLGPTFYIASRYVLSVSLLIAPFFINRKLNTGLAFAVHSAITALIVLSVFYWKIFPDCIVEGVGLTPFKVISDYVICLILAGAISFLLANRQSFDPRVLRIIVGSLILSIATGGMFTLYVDPFGLTNLIGHFFQIGSFYLVYLAFVETGFTRPQEVLFQKLQQNREKLAENLKQSEHANKELRQEIAARKQAEEALRESELKFRSFVEASAQIIWTVNAAAEVDMAIPAWQELTGQSVEEARGMGWMNAIHPDDRRRVSEAWHRAIETHGFYEVEYRLRIHDGTWREIQARGVPIQKEDGTVKEYIGTCIDITDRKHAEAALAAHAAQLEDVNKSLESFSYSVSHDLRAPLRAISGYAWMILKKQGETFDEETGRRFQVIMDSASKMGLLIDDLLAFSRLGTQAVAKESLDLGSLVDEVWHELLTANPDRKMALKMGQMPATWGDRALVRQVYSNLLGNAVKFTQTRASALIEVGSEIRGGERIYYVRDNGVGFNMAYYEKLFGVFQRLHSDEEYQGTGIGLALVKRIIERHGGRVWAESKVGEGATFYFTLSTL